MSDIHAILFSNESFYLAFARRDMGLMEDLWAIETPVSCAHPGWELIHGRNAVLDSWHNIFSAAQPPFAIECHCPTAHFTGDLGYVTCYEVMNETSLLATNIFVHEKNIWKMVHHQAGPAPLPTDENGENTPPGGSGDDIPTTLQ